MTAGFIALAVATNNFGAGGFFPKSRSSLGDYSSSSSQPFQINPDKVVHMRIFSRTDMTELLMKVTQELLNENSDYTYSDYLDVVIESHIRMEDECLKSTVSIQNHSLLSYEEWKEELIKQGIIK